MATCILNISIDGDNRDAPIITSTEFRRDKFFDAETRKFFFDSNDTDVDQESILRKVLQEFMYDATNKLQEERRILLARKIKDENFDFTFIDEDGDKMSLSIGGNNGMISFGIIDAFDEMPTSPVIVNANFYIKGYYPENVDEDSDNDANNDVDKETDGNTVSNFDTDVEIDDEDADENSNKDADDDAAEDTDMDYDDDTDINADDTSTTRDK